MVRLTRGDSLAVMRRLIVVVWGIAAAGSLMDLMLLEHYEDEWQLVPLVLIGLSAAVLIWQLLTATRLALRVFQLAMLLCFVSGAVGVVLHYRANMEFQLDIDPAMDRRELFWKVIRAKAPPALAPGVMMQLALLGLLSTYRHPALGRGTPIEREA